MVKLHAATLDGIVARVVDVECAFHKGLPSFNVVGLADSSIQEAKERVKAALGVNGFSFPPLKITVGLFPSDLPKSGSHFDLAIALSIVLCDAAPHKLDEFLILGELGLDGAIRATNSIFPIVLSLISQNLQYKILAPTQSAQFLSKIPNIQIYPAETLSQALAFARGEILINPMQNTQLDSEKIEFDNCIYYYDRYFGLDFMDVKGQKIAKRAALIAASGFHNILLEGSPGCGKSMIIKRMRYILPPMTLEDVLDISTREFLDGATPSFGAIRPYRAPHHTATRAAIFGGGCHSQKIMQLNNSYCNSLKAA